MRKKTRIGYVIAFNKRTRTNVYTYYLYIDDEKIYKTDYIIEASVFKSKQEAEDFIKTRDDERLYIMNYDIEVI